MAFFSSALFAPTTYVLFAGQNELALPFYILSITIAIGVVMAVTGKFAES